MVPGSGHDSADPSPPGRPFGEVPPRRIGPYRILERIGEGGMGTVYVAEQREPIQRRVAVKLIRAGFDTGEVLARFQMEHQALALMDHSNIARVYDAGATAEGRSYFVMEYVPGTPIAEFCDRHRLSIEERLALFVQVCHGVQHAHQKGIIHRDLKPTNILVMLQDDVPVPKIIDFGVAKAIGQRLTASTLHTQLGQILGTPAYMSPEQADSTVEDIDTRTDVYSLGAILYELLSGDVPLGEGTIRRAGLIRIQELIRDSTPPRPSERVMALEQDARTTTAGNRSTEAGTLGRRIRGDLDWITMRALERERTRRYASASELAADVERHLRSEPVVAGPPTLAYRLRKFVARNLAGVIAALTVVAALLVGFLVSTMLYLEAENARRATEKAKRTALENEQRAQATANLLARQKLETQAKYEEARGNLALFHWEAGDRAYAENRAADACREYVAGLRNGVETVDELFDTERLGWKRPWAVRPRLAGAVAQLAGAPRLLYPGWGAPTFSPDESQLAVAARGGGVVVWTLPHGETGAIVRTKGHLTHLFFLDDDRLAYLNGSRMDGARLGTIHLSTGKVEQRRHLDSFCDAATLFPGRQRLAVGLGDGRTEIVRAASSESLFVLTPRIVEEEEQGSARVPSDRAISAVAIHRDGSRLLTHGRDGILRLWDLERREELAVQELRGRIGGLGFIDAEHAAVWSPRGLYEVAFSGEKNERRTIWKGPLLDCVALEDGGWFVLTTDSFGRVERDGSSRLEPLPSDLTWIRAKWGDSPRATAIPQASKRWIVSRVGPGFLLYDRLLGNWSHRAGSAARYTIANAFSRDGSVLAAGRNYFRRFPGRPEQRYLPPEVFQLRPGGANGVLSGHDLRFPVVAVSLDGRGRCLVTSDESGVLRVYEGPDWTLRASGQPAAKARALAMSDDGTRIYAAGEDGRLRVLGADDLSSEKTVKQFDAGVILAAHPEGGIWTGHEDGTLVLRDARTLEPTKRLRVERSAVYAIVVSPSGRSLAAVDSTGAMRFWPDLDPERHWSRREELYESGAFSSTEELFAMGLDDGRIEVLDTGLRTVVARFDTGNRGVPAIRFADQDRTILYLGFDTGPGRIRLPKSIRIRRIRDHAAPIIGMATHPTRVQFASLDQSGRLQIRDLDDPKRSRVVQLALPEASDKGSRIHRLLYSPDGEFLAAGIAGLQLVNARTGSIQAKLEPEGDGAAIEAFAFSPRSEHARLCYVSSGRLLAASLPGLSERRPVTELPDLRVTRLAIDPAGRFCAIGTWDAGVLVADLDGNRVRWQAQYPDIPEVRTGRWSDANAVVFLEAVEGRVLVAISDCSRVVAFRLSDGTILARRSHWFWDAHTAVRSAQTNVIISGTSQQGGDLNLSAGRRRERFYLELPQPAGRFTEVGLLADGHIVASDRHQLFVVPFDLRVLALDAEAAASYVQQKLESAASPTADLRAWYRLRPLRLR
ncbi:MAG: protein kinase domain-containing protein [Planctomycetota bacterium]